MKSKHLIDLCRSTHLTMPSGKKIAAVVERLRNERAELAYALQVAVKHLPEGDDVEADRVRCIARKYNLGA